MPLEVLQNQKYRDVVSIRLYYDWSTYVLNVGLYNLLNIHRLHRDELMEECVRMMQQSLRSSAGTIKKRAKSVYQQRNLGTIKERKKEKQQEKEVTNGQTIMQILRMRYVPPCLPSGHSKVLLQAGNIRVHCSAITNSDPATARAGKAL